jgi:diadenosine tetraphosphatase ApaH/serine/threonine PP2A family protein phosphatase
MRHGTEQQMSGKKRSRSRSAELRREEGETPGETMTTTSRSPLNEKLTHHAAKHGAANHNRVPHSSPKAGASAADVSVVTAVTAADAAAVAANSATATSPTSGMSAEDVGVYTLVTSILADWRSGVTLLKEDVIRTILRRVRPIVMSQPMLVRTEAPINVCGDIHGQITDLVEIFKAGGLPPNSRYLFLGDYVDRGKYGTEVITVLLGLKVLYPKRIFILRGNHETDSICRIYGFFDECKRRFSVRLFKEFTDVFNCLPVAALIEEIALCMHGGLSPELRHLRQIEQIYRPLVVPDEGLACDILWADPEEGSSGWQPSERGVSFTFGEDVVKRVCDSLGIDIVLRAHQVVDEGYSFFAGRRLVTIFSASNYCGEFTNSGAMMLMDENCMCSFQIFKPEY